ncbi:DUF5807 family protein [Halorhabdus sp. CUG00001]|uniref:DUF5807 family protein n=1 Tax=Halorhabdus sp. CUG00001 TaxID=2600297 RepID=UPI00131DEF88|nr:DUF5807 family protein [Halorhabdus sp. CUG00001]
MTDREAFLAGDRPDDVAVFLHEAAVSNPEALESYAESVEGGVVLVLPGEDGRSAFQSATDIDPMALAQEAMDTEGHIDDDLTGGTCPVAEDDPDGDHTVRFVFAFAEAQNEDVGGLYADGDVIHAYAACACGQRYSEKWVAGDE